MSFKSQKDLFNMQIAVNNSFLVIPWTSLRDFKGTFRKIKRK